MIGLTWKRPGLRVRSFLRIALAIGALLACAVPAHAEPFSLTALLATVYTSVMSAAGIGSFTIFGVQVATVLAAVTIAPCGHGRYVSQRKPNT